MVPYYTSEQQAKFSVKPGVTGLAQTSGRGILTLQETIGLDLAYVDQRCMALDLRILLRTARVVPKQIGAF